MEFVQFCDDTIYWSTENVHANLWRVVGFLRGSLCESVTPLSGPSSNVGFLASTDNDVLNWVSRNEGSHAFCFPTESAGPDIFFYVRSKATGKLLLVAVQAKHYKDVDKITLVEGVHTVTQSFFWKSKNKKVFFT